MAIMFLHKEIGLPIERMLQGITCLMGYKDSIRNRRSYEAEFVIAACEILQSYLGRKEYDVVMEYPYQDIVNNSSLRQESDLVIIKKGDNKEDKGNVLCVMEFKMSTDTNGGVDKDINKLRLLPNNIVRLSILLFLKPNNSLRSRFVTDVFTAKTNQLTIEKNKYLQKDTQVCVRRVTKAFLSQKSERPPYMAVCIEVK